jgi:molecular chaperone HscB
VDLKQLRSEFLKLQATAHPDRHPPERKVVAEALSARINEAYKTLQSPLLRAQYLLSLRGNESSTDDAAKLGDDADDQELLLEVLELREQIEDAETGDQIRDIKEENDVRIAESVKILEDAFETDQVDEAAKEAVKLRYWMNVDETLHAWEEGRPPPNLNH